MIVDSLYDILTELDIHEIKFYTEYVDRYKSIVYPVYNVRKGQYPQTYSFIIKGFKDEMLTLRDVYIDGLTFNDIPTPDNWSSYFVIKVDNIFHDTIFSILNKYRRRD